MRGGFDIKGKHRRTFAGDEAVLYLDCGDGLYDPRYFFKTHISVHSPQSEFSYMQIKT